jgi:hypothetical protein
VSGQAPAYSVFFQNFPACSVAVDSAGSVYVALCESVTVLKFNAGLAPVTSFDSQAASALTAASVNFSSPIYPQAMAVSVSGWLWLLDTANLGLLLLSTTAAPTAVSAFSLRAQMGGTGLAIATGTDNVWVLLQAESQPLWLFSPQGAVLRTLGNATSPQLDDFFVMGLTTDTAANLYLGGCSPVSAFVPNDPVSGDFG